MFTQFFLFGTLGLIAEIIFTSIKRLISDRAYKLRGETSLWMFPVYGSIAFIFPLLKFRIGGFPWYTRGIVYMLAFFVIEYVSGLILRKLKVCPWEYPSKFSLNGLIYFPYAPVWFAAGLGVEKIYPFVLRLALHL